MRKPAAVPHLALAFLCLVLSDFPTRAHAASFDCKAARSPRETAVCNDPKLSELDTRLGHAYTALRSTLSPAASAAVASDQREWLSWLDRVCPPGPKNYGDSIGNCLTNQYTSRLRQLTNGYRAADGLVFYPRAHYVLVPHKKGTEPYAPTDPGFGTGAFSWPQIDSTAADAVSWNKAVLAEALRIAATDAVRSPTTFDSTTDDGDEIEIFYRLRALNRNLLVVDLGNSTYGYGGAHPNTNISTFSWWLNRGRALTATDVFAPASGWQTKLASTLVAKVRTRFPPDDTFGGPKLPGVVAETLASVNAWTLSSSGLTVTFPLYAIAPYAEGMPVFHFSWAELRPYLVSGFQPTGLPQPIPQPKL